MIATRHPDTPDKPIRDAASELAQLLREVRRSLPPGGRVCRACQHVFRPVFATEARCPACERAVNKETP